MNLFKVDRFAYHNSDVSTDWIITGIGHSKLNINNIKTVNIKTLDEFEAGCKLHEQCLGHIGKSESGLLLPIQSMSVHNSTMSNDVYMAVSIALSGKSEYHKEKYIEKLRSSMKGKTGRMRKGILNAHIDGSLRMIITPQWQFPTNTIVVPQYLSGIWKVCRLDYETNIYITLPVSDGDHAIVIRPPSLSSRAVQPMVIRFWNETCLGISPEILKAFEGDYDGDEIHVYPVYSREAIEESKHWKNTPNRSIQKAESIFRDTKIPDKDLTSGSYMMHTTMSFNQIMAGSQIPLMAEQTRTRIEHILPFAERLNNTESVRLSFTKESIRGMGDINRQQLSQPIVGDMSRIARIAASCVSQRSDGMIGIWSSNGFNSIIKLPLDESMGNSAVRAISTICASAQQVALDSHRMQVGSMPSHDLIRDLIVGSLYTLVMIKYDISAPLYIPKDGLQWRYLKDGTEYILCKPAAIGNGYANSVIGTYNPSILSKVAFKKRYDVCFAGISMLVDYYSIMLSQIEIASLTVLFTYKPESSNEPITSRSGFEARKMQWIETTMATHYMGLVKRLTHGSIPISPVMTVSSCLMAANIVNSISF